jgi:electron transfer flavoprotein alpha subunit
MAILVFLECRDSEVKHSSHEAVAEARRLADQGLGGGQVVAVLVAPAAAGPKAAQAGHYGADQVLHAAHDAFANYLPDVFAGAVVEAQKKVGATHVFFSASAMGKDLAPRVAARLDAGLASDCTHLDVEGGRLVATRPVYAGKAIQKVGWKSAVALASLRPKVFALTEHRPGKDAPVEPLAGSFDPSLAKVVTTGTSAATSGPADLTEADIIVSGGRGLKGPENFHLIESLAQALGATVGASRAVVDAGWRPHGEQVGQTGKTVSPKLYVAIGISGAIQHLAGMSSSRTIVAINKDADAPIFKVANYGIVGDAFEIVPALVEEVKKLR